MHNGPKEPASSRINIIVWIQLVALTESKLFESCLHPLQRLYIDKGKSEHIREACNLILTCSCSFFGRSLCAKSSGLKIMP